MLSPAPWVPSFQRWRVTKTHGSCPYARVLASMLLPLLHHTSPAPEPNCEARPLLCASACISAAPSGWSLKEFICPSVTSLWEVLACK